MSHRDRPAERRRNSIGGWLDDVRDLPDDEEATDCQWPGCSGAVDVVINALAAGGGTLRVSRHTIELEPHGREGMACFEHGRFILERLPRDEIGGVEILVDPDWDYTDQDRANMAAILALYPDAG